MLPVLLSVQNSDATILHLTEPARPGLNSSHAPKHSLLKTLFYSLLIGPSLASSDAAISPEKPGAASGD